ncbi:MAG: phosphatidate cytidylyltransferase, partial [Alistipes sp.]|nr:phosphatidate cytidylyltransferase [Alistipes sp.]
MSQLLNKTFYLRTASGIGLLVIVLGCVLGSPFTMLLLTLTLTAGAMTEFYRIGRLSGVEPLRVYPILIGILLLPVAFLIKVQVFPPQILLFFPPLLFGLFLTELYRNRATPISNIAWEVTGILYVAVPMALLTTLPLGGWEADSLRYSPLLFLSILFMVWANDVGAYLFGVLFGHRK